MDHLDTASLRALTERFPQQLTVITAAYTADLIESFAWHQVVELDWGEQYQMSGLTSKWSELQCIFAGVPQPNDGFRRRYRFHRVFRALLGH